MSPDELGQLLDELGRRLGPGGEYVFRLAVQRVIVASSISIAFGVFLIAAAGFYTRFALGRYRKAKVPPERPGFSSWSSSDGDGWLFSLAGAALIAVVGLAFIGDSAIDLLTPEYTALRDILSAVGATR